jgi:hypothetical protein
MFTFPSMSNRTGISVYIAEYFLFALIYDLYDNMKYKNNWNLRGQRRKAAAYGRQREYDSGVYGYPA